MSAHSPYSPRAERVRAMVIDELVEDGGLDRADTDATTALAEPETTLVIGHVHWVLLDVNGEKFWATLDLDGITHPNSAHDVTAVFTATFAALA